jgi:hypothetical protein
MAYVPANLSKVAGGVGGPAIWYLTGTDVHTDVDAADFISDGYDKGMKVGDILHYVKSTATIGATTHSVQTVTTGGAATLSPAILT